MKKLITLSAILSISSCILIAEMNNSPAPLAKVNPKAGSGALVIGRPGAGQNVEKKIELRHYKTFGLSVDNQITVLNQLRRQKGIGDLEAVRYFLSLKNNNNKKALDVLSKEGNDDLRLLLLAHLPVDEFAKLLNELFDGIGGEAIRHWGYREEGKFESLHMVPCARAQQYVNFFMCHDIKIDTQVQAEGTFAQWTGTKKTIKTESEELLHARGQRIAEVLNTMDENKVIELLYGRPDTRIIGNKDRIVLASNAGRTSMNDLFMQINGTDYVYQTYEERTNQYGGKLNPEWYSKQEADYKRHTWSSRVFSNSIKYIVPYLTTKLTYLVFVKETNGDTDGLIKMVKSLGCDKALGDELFEFLSDEIKDKVFESCQSEEGSVNDLLGYGSTLAIGSGSEPKDPEAPAEIAEVEAKGDL